MRFHSKLLVSALALACASGCLADDSSDSEPSWQELKDQTRETIDGVVVYRVEGDLWMTESELRAYYDAYVAQADEGIGTSEQRSTVNRVTDAGGDIVDDIYLGDEALQLTYCVSTRFTAAERLRALTEMSEATAAWAKVANVRFLYTPSEDASCNGQNRNIVLAVTPWTGNGACAPIGRSRKGSTGCPPGELVMNFSTFDTNPPAPSVTSRGVFRHELGHVLGLRHEHIRAEAGNPTGNGCTEPIGTVGDVTTYDVHSVMHYQQCNGVTTSDFVISPLDVAGIQSLYGTPDLAYGKPATQSSTFDVGDASRAVDGRIDGIWANGSVTHTNGDAGAWWQVDLGATTDIGQVTVYGRSDCCTDRLANFDVLVSNDGAAWRAIASQVGAAAVRTRFQVDASGRFVRIQLRGTGFLSLAEVAVQPPRNLAAGKKATQSSTLLDGAAARAVDGNPDGAWASGSVTHTNNNPQAWWQVDLGAVTSLGKIVVHNRTDCCRERLVDFDVKTSIDGVNFTTAATLGGFAPARTTLSLRAEARFVRVQLRGTGFLSLAEVQVFPPPNLALDKPAAQSSTPGFGAPASRAVDGSTDGRWARNSVTHTDRDAQAWWQVDLGQVSDLGKVIVYGRNDCCMDRLSDFDILTSDDGASWTAQVSRNGQASAREFFLVSVRARFVRVQLRGQNFLSLAEVQVFPPQDLALGKNASQSSTPTWGGPAARAVDGNPDGNWANGSVTHTDLDVQAWWQVDLGPDVHIGKIVVTGRSDCCTERLSFFDVLVSDDGVLWSPVGFVPGIAPPRSVFEVNATHRYVRVQLRVAGFLSLAEVEVQI